MKFCAKKKEAYQFLNKYLTETDVDLLTDWSLESFIHPGFED